MAVVWFGIALLLVYIFKPIKEDGKEIVGEEIHCNIFAKTLHLDGTVDVQTLVGWDGDEHKLQDCINEPFILPADVWKRIEKYKAKHKLH
jgi:hypothetical protein